MQEVEARSRPERAFLGEREPPAEIMTEAKDLRTLN